MSLLITLSLLLGIAALGYLYLGVKLLRGKREIGTLPLAFTFIVIGYWVLGGAVELVANSYLVFSIGRAGHFVGTALVPVTLLLCFREVTGRVTSPQAIIALLIVPVLTVIVASTNYWHELLWPFPPINYVGRFLTRPDEFGPWFYYIHAPYGYAVIAVSVFTLIMHSPAVAPSQRRDLYVLAGSTVVPVAALVAYDLGLGPSTYSILPFVFFFMLPVYAWMSIGDGVIDFTPLAYETVFQNMQDPVIVLDENERIISLNHGAELLLNMSEADALRKHLDNVFGGDAVEVHAAIDSGKPQKMLTASGRFLHVQVTPIETKNAVASHASVLMFRDVSDFEKAQREIVNSEKLLRTLIDHSVNGIVRLRWFEPEDPAEAKTLRCIFANGAAARYLNITQEQMIDKTVEELLLIATTGMDQGDRSLLLQEFMAATDKAEVIDTEIHVETAGVQKWLRMIGEPVGDDVAITLVDFTDGKAKEKRMESIAKSDPLTGVLNRRGFERDAAQRLTESADDATGALLFIDLNGFKQVNDRHGHEVGDQLLTIAAERLQQGLRSCDIIGRPGGDEFVALVTDVQADIAENLAIRLTNALDQPYLINNEQLRCAASIGLALYPVHANTLTGLLRAADAAMYRAKARSRNVTAIGASGLLEKAG